MNNQDQVIITVDDMNKFKAYKDAVYHLPLISNERVVVANVPHYPILDEDVSFSGARIQEYRAMLHVTTTDMKEVHKLIEYATKEGKEKIDFLDRYLYI